MKKLSTALLILLATSVNAQNNTEMTDEIIKKRLAPIGAVYLAGAAPAVVVPTGPRTGQQVFQNTCFGCHGTGAMGAPKTAADWAPRISKGSDVLLNHAINGFNSMPPKGTCFDCSEDELQAAIDFMTK